jgi:hypothetical protein
MAWTDGARWYESRLAHNRKPAHYRCPLCGNQLPSMMEHTLLFPEGDHSKRRHAHSECVMQARRAGKLLTRDEWVKRQKPSRDQPTSSDQDRPGRLASARRILWALRPRLSRSRPSDS